MTDPDPSDANPIDANPSDANSSANPAAKSPVKIRREGEAIVIAWDDQTEDRWTPGQLREACPCATCREKRAGKEDQAAPTESKRPRLPVLSAAEARPLQVESMQPVGNYGYNVRFSDGHHSGIFTFGRLSRTIDPTAHD